MSQDYLMRNIHHWDGDQPYDEYGHALDHEDVAHRPASTQLIPWGPVVRLPDAQQARDLTSPYGSLQYCVGSGDDFHCFDWGRLKDGRIALHACVNSETGSFIMDTCYEIVMPEAAVGEAIGLVDRALEWCYDNRVKHDYKGWNQDPYYFARCVACAVGALKRRPVRRAIKNRVPPTTIFDSVFCTSFCNYGHRMGDGKPIGHECYILPPEALKAEHRGDLEEAQRLLACMPRMRILHKGLPGRKGRDQ